MTAMGRHAGPVAATAPPAPAALCTLHGFHERLPARPYFCASSVARMLPGADGEVCPESSPVTSVLAVDAIRAAPPFDAPLALGTSASGTAAARTGEARGGLRAGKRGSCARATGRSRAPSQGRRRTVGEQPRLRQRFAVLLEAARGVERARRRPCTAPASARQAQQMRPERGTCARCCLAPPSHSVRRPATPHRFC